VDYNKIKLILAQNSVFDSFQFIESMYYFLELASFSKKIIEDLSKYILDKKDEEEKKVYDNLQKHKSAEISAYDTNVLLINNKIDSYFLIEKNMIDFFQYLRSAYEAVYQFINSSLFSDDAFNVGDVSYHSIKSKIKNFPIFNSLELLLNNITSDSIYQYITDFNNHVKHIKNISLSVKISFLIGSNKNIDISEFQKKENKYDKKDLLDFSNDCLKKVIKDTDDLIDEIIKLVPNTLNTTNRVHDIKMKIIYDKDQNVNSFGYYIDVLDNISELPSSISILPLIIHNNEVDFINLEVDTVFIRDKNDKIIGKAVAEIPYFRNLFLKYRKFNVSSASTIDYFDYYNKLKKNGYNIKSNYAAIKTTSVFLK